MTIRCFLSDQSDAESSSKAFFTESSYMISWRKAQSRVIKGILIDPFVLIHEILCAENREIYYISNMIRQKI